MSKHAFGYVEHGKLFLKGFRDFPDREIGEVKDDEAAAFHYFEERFAVLEKKVEALEQTVEKAENKGSYLMKLLHFKKLLAIADALGDFETLYGRLEKLENELMAIIAENRKKNLEIKTALLQDAEELAGSTNWKEDGEKIKELKSKWLKTGNVDKEHQEAIDGRFEAIVNDFFIRRKAFFEDKQEIYAKRISVYENLIQEAREASQLAPGNAIKELIRLQKEWKGVGKVPSQQLEKLWNEFREINDKVFQHKKGQGKHMAVQESRKVALTEEELLAKKNTLLKEIKTLNELKDKKGKNIVAQVKELRSAWKRLGWLSKEYKKMNDDFFFTCEMVVEKNFINELANNKGLEGKSEQEKLLIKEKILRDLLSRDQSELETFQENMAKMTMNTDAANRLMNTQLRLQTRKVLIKKAILEELVSKKAD